ncbi:MAG: ABC transporter permease [Desulfarculaceae bacterium]|nr:ABC transporter permease [Desulfarculaceae bacterium]MCF8099387.1 ABC transporter permease [Desulfarculaceae bacterium]MCF8124455.1 ABC transporter permease [Desulfarculaceae bacterium]
MDMLKTVIRLALRGLLAYKARSLLTMLGIIIGIGAVIVMISVGRGANASIQKQINDLGANMLMVYAGSSKQGGVRGGYGSKPTLRARDAQAIARECPAVSEVTHITLQTAQVVAGEKNWNTTVYGTTASYPVVRDWLIKEGEFLTDQHLRSASNVAVLGATVVQNLFQPGETVVGRKIRIRNVPFTIIGVLAPKGSDPRGKDQDNTLFVPYTTFSRKLHGRRLPGVVHVICLSARSKLLVNEAKREVEELLRQKHRIPPGAEDDFSVRALDEYAQMADKTMDIMTILLTSVAAISLVVGGIGIMNIMLVSVTERTREIGIRMAVGARERDVLIQFLTEAMTMSVLGGIFGTLLGVGAAKVIGMVTGWMSPIDVDAILLATLFSAGVGVFFGYYPARQASRMDLIEALRYE